MGSADGADSAEVLRSLKRRLGVTYPVLTPNLQGLTAAIKAGATNVAVFAAASETFSKKNINSVIAESIAGFLPVLESAKQHDVKVRDYVSCVVECPFEGRIAPDRIADVAARLMELGCQEISLMHATILREAF
ncbi:hypothetical protein [Bradyrhizobium sp. 186]|uniref:hypothetical protein n=1 Tax=Bradyrhizobium sp. 186 TaxID=2782654 RepID=UPI002000ED0C|nr:hypothetical protein [Bradyrhizobium sp. 186]